LWWPPQTINGLKKSILTILDPNYELGFFCGWSDDSVQQKQSENREIDAIFPNLRTLHPKILFSFAFGSHVHLKKNPQGPNIFRPHFGAVTTPN